MSKGSFTLCDCDCDSSDRNKRVVQDSMEVFTVDYVTATTSPAPMQPIASKNKSQ